MATPRAPRRVARDEPLAADTNATAGEGTYVEGGQVLAARDGVFEFDPATGVCVVRPLRKPASGTRRKRGERAPTDADLRDTHSRQVRSTTRDTAKLKKKKGRGDQGTWM